MWDNQTALLNADVKRKTRAFLTPRRASRHNDADDIIVVNINISSDFRHARSFINLFHIRVIHIKTARRIARFQVDRHRLPAFCGDDVINVFVAGNRAFYIG